jgi:hypothetical protein
MKVMVFQWPCRALATSLRPLGPQPRRGVMFVLIQVFRLDPDLVDEDETGGIDAGLTRLPAFALARDVRPILLTGEQAFF